MPTAARPANAGPYCSARKSETGPEVSGKPINSPLIVGPQRRPANVTTAMKKGVMTSLSKRIIKGRCYLPSLGTVSPTRRRVSITPAGSISVASRCSFS